MKRPSPPESRTSCFVGVLLLLIATRALLAEPTPAATAAFNTYCAAVEARLAAQHRSPSAFLALTDANERSLLRAGQLTIEQLTPPDPEVAGALLHHWRGTAFVPGATADGFERLMQDINAYPQDFAPDVLQARLLTRSGPRLLGLMRIRQHHVITVVMDLTFDLTVARPGLTHGYTISRSTRIAELASAATPAARPLSPSEEHGFLYRLNTYWSFEQRDGGLYLQIETVSLTRSIPRGLAWAVRPYIETIPRESLEFTLTSARNALRH